MIRTFCAAKLSERGAGVGMTHTPMTKCSTLGFVHQFDMVAFFTARSFLLMAHLHGKLEL